MKRSHGQESALLFDWRAHDRSPVRLALAVLATLGGVIALFVVFRIVAPESRPVDVRPRRVLVLNPRVEAERALIHQAVDRSFVLLPAENQAASPGPAAALPAFKPSFAGHQLRLQPLRSGPSGSTQARLFALDLNVLPHVPKPEGAVTPEAPPTRLEAVVEGPLVARLNGRFPIDGVVLTEATRPRFRIAVGPLGQVLLALPLMPAEDVEVTRQLQAAVSGMRFAPAPAEVEWGQVTFAWKPVSREGAP